MWKYVVKKPFTGWNIGLENYNEYVAVPKKYFFKNNLQVAVPVKLKSEVKFFTYDDKVMEKEQIQQFKGAGKHFLTYFLWKNHEE